MGHHLKEEIGITTIIILDCKTRGRNGFSMLLSATLAFFNSVLYTQKSLGDSASIFLDPNTFSEDGTVSLGTSAFSEDGELFAYTISQSGSDWQTIKVSYSILYFL